MTLICFIISIFRQKDWLMLVDDGVGRNVVRGPYRPYFVNVDDDDGSRTGFSYFFR